NFRNPSTRPYTAGCYLCHPRRGPLPSSEVKNRLNSRYDAKEEAMLESLRDGLQNAVKKLLGASTVDEQAVKEFVRDLQRTLIQADVNVRLVFELTERVQ